MCLAAFCMPSGLPSSKPAPAGLQPESACRASTHLSNRQVSGNLLPCQQRQQLRDLGRDVRLPALQEGQVLLQAGSRSAQDGVGERELAQAPLAAAPSTSAGHWQVPSLRRGGPLRIAFWKPQIVCRSRSARCKHLVLGCRLSGRLRCGHSLAGLVTGVLAAASGVEWVGLCKEPHSRVAASRAAGASRGAGTGRAALVTNNQSGRYE